MPRFILAFLGFSLLGFIIVSKNVESRAFSTQDRCKPCFRPQLDPNKQVENKWPNVTSVELDKTEVRWPSPEGSPLKYPSYSRELSASVKTIAEDPEGDILTYSYTVTGGRIVGTGRNVFWDLYGVWPGSYTITAAVDDGCGQCGAKMTKTVNVLPAVNAPVCLCPEISIGSLRGKTSSPVPVFSADLSGPQPPDLQFAWTVSEGTISSGQGTRRITVRPPDELSDQNATVTVAISGLEPSCDCPRTATKTFKYW